MRWLRMKVAGWLIRAGVAMLPPNVRTLYGFMSGMGLAWLKNDDLVKQSLSDDDFSFVVDVSKTKTVEAGVGEGQ